MIEPAVMLRLLGDSRTYQPGDLLRADYRLELPNWNNLKAIEKSVLWYTEGKGDEDLGIHFFQRSVAEEFAELEAGDPGRFETVLPLSPLSYDGVLIRVHWCARIRVFLSRGRQVIAEQPFKLGNIPPANLVVYEPPAAEEDASENKRSSSTPTAGK